MRAARTAVLMSLVFLTSTAFAQITVDATGPIRESRRKCVGGSGGSSGRRLPIKVTLLAYNSPIEDDAVVEFVLTNTGHDDLVLPISPHASDVEPDDPTAEYSFTSLGLVLTSDRMRKNVAAQVSLRGREEHPETLTKLAPGASIRVLVKAKFRARARDEAGSLFFVAFAGLSYEKSTVLNGEEFLDTTKEIGSAESPEYSLESLFFTD